MNGDILTLVPTTVLTDYSNKQGKPNSKGTIVSAIFKIASI